MSLQPEADTAVEPTQENALGSRLLKLVEWWIDTMEINSEALGIPVLTRSQAMLCAHVSLGEHRPIRLAALLGVSRQAVHFILAQLEELGIVEVRKDPDDRRATIVEITAAHSGVSDSYGLLMRSIECHLAERFGAEDFAIFRRIACSDWGEAPLVPLVHD